jgi:hypothetical protein
MNLHNNEELAVVSESKEGLIVPEEERPCVATFPMLKRSTLNVTLQRKGKVMSDRVIFPGFGELKFVSATAMNCAGFLYLDIDRPSLPVMCSILDAILAKGIRVAGSPSGREDFVMDRERLSRMFTAIMSVNTVKGGGVEAVKERIVDEIKEISDDGNLVIGFMKKKKKSIKDGHAQIRIEPDKTTLICRHYDPNGLRAIFTSALHRLDITYPGANAKVTQPPQIVVDLVRDDLSRFVGAVEWLRSIGCNPPTGHRLRARVPMVDQGDLTYGKYRAKIKLNYWPSGTIPELVEFHNTEFWVSGSTRKHYKAILEMFEWANVEEELWKNQ